MQKKAKKPTKVIACVAGHGGGHMLPTITKAKQLLHEDPTLSILFFSTTAPLDQKILANNQFTPYLVSLDVESVPYNRIFRFPIFAFKIGKAFIRSLYWLRNYRPAYVLSMGGYVSLPVCFAARLLGIPIQLYELNLEPGKAIQALARFSSEIFITYPESARYFPQHCCQLASYPVRFSRNAKEIKRLDALNMLNFSSNKKTIFILGGSQGSAFLNELIKTYIERHPTPEKLQVIHQTGMKDSFDWQKFYAQYRVTALTFSYHEKLEHLYSAADVLICRAGAGTLAEALFFDKKCIVIPLEAATTSHQLLNAQALSRRYPEKMVVLRQKDATVEAIQTYLATFEVSQAILE